MCLTVAPLMWSALTSRVNACERVVSRAVRWLALSTNTFVCHRAEIAAHALTT